jgi:hypothetical protein
MTNAEYDETHDDNRPIRVHELKSVLEETEAMLSEMRDVINVHAEVLACHKFVLERFVPKELFKQAVKEYYAARKEQIEVETAAEEALDTDASKAN